MQNLQPTAALACVSNLFTDLYSGSLDAEKPSRIKSSFLLSPCKLFFSKHEVGLMNAFRTQLEHVGITFKEAVDEHRSLSNQQQQSVIITTVPSVFLGRDQSEIRSMPPGMESDIEVCIFTYFSDDKRLTNINIIFFIYNYGSGACERTN